jgi:hypothetical protein
MARLNPRYLDLPSQVPRLLNNMLLTRQRNCQVILTHQIAARNALPALRRRRRLQRGETLLRCRRVPALRLRVGQVVVEDIGVFGVN